MGLIKGALNIAKNIPGVDKFAKVAEVGIDLVDGGGFDMKRAFSVAADLGLTAGLGPVGGAIAGGVLNKDGFDASSLLGNIKF